MDSTKNAERCMLTVVSNDGDIAICTASVNGTVVDTVEFEREEDSRAEFLASFTVGTINEAISKVVDDEGLADLKDEAFILRQEAKGKQKPRRCQGD
jgi:hypothetical protein